MPEQIPLSGSFVAATGARLLEMGQPPNSPILEGPAQLQPSSQENWHQYSLRHEGLFRAATDSYIFGYPLVLMDLTLRVMTNFSRICPAGAPINQFLHGNHFDEAFPSDLSQNNVDMICSSAWIDLSDEPVILSLPEMGKRFHTLQMLDAWTNIFASIGTRNTGNSKTYFAITGPSWRGSLPLGLRQIKSPTNLALLVGRIQVHDGADCSLVRKLQTHYKLAPLSAWDKTYFPPDTLPIDRTLDMTTPATTQVARMDGTAFFLRLMDLMKRNPPPMPDKEILSSLLALGVTSGDMAFFDHPDSANVIRAGVERARAILESAENSGVLTVNGWRFSTNTGRYGSDYLRRAAASQSGISTSILEDAVCFRTGIDADGHKLTGKCAYVLHFLPKKTPPVKAFWSLAVCGEAEPVQGNPASRLSISGHGPLVLNHDGSLDIYIQHGPPNGVPKMNWLPTPRNEFDLILRLYWPKTDVWEGRWVLPAVHLVSEKLARVA